MTNEQLKVLLNGYLAQLRHDGHCEANLPQHDFLLMKEYIKSKKFTTSESNADNVLNVHVDGKTIKIGGY